MFFQKFKTPALAHVAYLVADKTDALLVDPRRDIEEYVAVAQANKLVIRYVLETHRQEDFVLGSLRLKEELGARIVSGDHELFGHSDVRLRDGERFKLDSLELLALHTPGHTPESTCYALFVSAAPELALGVFTGDTLFIGETGRTDLSDRERTSEHAGQLYDAVHDRLLPLGDQVILWPAHGSGSVCGGNIAQRDESTLGLERVYNPVFTNQRDAFIRSKIEERIPRPPYFSHMERVNLEGGMPAGKTATQTRALDPKRFASEMTQGLVIDSRDPEAFAAGHIAGSINVWLAGLPVFAGWIAREDTPLYLVVPRMSDVAVAVTHLARVGLDQVAAVLAGGFDSWRDAGLPIESSGTMSARELQNDLVNTAVLDVREDSEFENEGHIRGARHLYVGHVEGHIQRFESDLKEKSAIAVTCSVGHRAGLAASLLLRKGFSNVNNVLGGMTAWQELELPTSRDREHTATTPEIEGERK